MNAIATKKKISVFGIDPRKKDYSVSHSAGTAYAEDVIECFKIIQPPKPPEYKPWEELPLEAFDWIFRDKNGNDEAAMCYAKLEACSLDRKVASVLRSPYTIFYLFKNFEYTPDHGKTWLPCGEVVK